jgi:rhamnosyltransferase
MPADSPILATVAILTYNGEKYIRQILEKLRAQEIDGEFEVLVIDSGSTDGTLAVIAEFPEVRLLQIPNEEFGHGRTRNLAAHEARGEFVAYLTHDAVPTTPHWLAALLEPMRRFPEVAAVLGKQVARPRAFPLQRYEIHGMFRNLGPDYGITLFYRHPDLPDEPAVIDAMSYYSDVNSATRRSFLLNEIPYHDVRYAEDQMFGRDIITAGLVKAYAPRASVTHSNDLTYAEYGHRIFDETVGLRQIGADLPPMSRAEMLKHAVRGTLGDSVRIALDRSYRVRRRLYWLVVNPAYHFKKWNSYRRSTLVDIADHEAVRSGSLEHRRKAPGS